MQARRAFAVRVGNSPRIRPARIPPIYFLTGGEWGKRIALWERWASQRSWCQSGTGRFCALEPCCASAREHPYPVKSRAFLSNQRRLVVMVRDRDSRLWAILRQYVLRLYYPWRRNRDVKSRIGPSNFGRRPRSNPKILRSPGCAPPGGAGAGRARLG